MNVFTYAVVVVTLFFQVAISQTNADTTLLNKTKAPDALVSAPDVSKDSLKNPDSLKTASTLVDSSKTAKKAPVIEETEEQLILDGGEESIIPAAADKKTEHVNSVSDSTHDTMQASSPDSTKTADSTALANDTVASQNRYVSPIPVVKEEKVATKIEAIQSMNFAKNLKEYRSPKIAMLLSLLVPGTGQAFAKDYLKTGIFGAVEVAVITVGAVLRYQGGEKWKKAEKFANLHYRIDKFEEYAGKLTNSNIDTAMKRNIFYPDTTPVAFLKDAKSKNDDFYESIRSATNPYVHGWDDVTPNFTDGFEIENPTTDSGTYFQNNDSTYLIYFVNNDGDTVPNNSQYGFSRNQGRYNDKIQDANNTYRWSGTVFTMLLVSHIASAVDAGITAKAHNDQLLGRKTVWQNINVIDNVVATPIEKASGLALEVRF